MMQGRDHHSKWTFSLAIVLISLGILGNTQTLVTDKELEDYSKLESGKPLLSDFFEQDFGTVIKRKIIKHQVKVNYEKNEKCLEETYFVNMRERCIYFNDE